MWISLLSQDVYIFNFDAKSWSKQTTSSAPGSSLPVPSFDCVQVLISRPSSYRPRFRHFHPRPRHQRLLHPSCRFIRVAVPTRPERDHECGVEQRCCVGSGLEHELPAGGRAGCCYGGGEQSYQYVERLCEFLRFHIRTLKLFLVDFFNVPNNPAGSTSMFVIHCKYPGCFFRAKRHAC